MPRLAVLEAGMGQGLQTDVEKQVAQQIEPEEGLQHGLASISSSSAVPAALPRRTD